MDNTTDIDILVHTYGDADAQMKGLKKTCDGLKETIKEYLATHNEKAISAGGYTVQRVVSERESLNEEKLIPILKQYWATNHGSMECPFIKTKEYVDMDRLEEAIYQKELTPSVLAEMEKCREVTTVVALKCKKNTEE